MWDLPAFLRRLELDGDADEKAVRRAYARCLKAIDQERDLDGFQQLRDAYERALEWARDQAQVAVAGLSSAAPDAGPAARAEEDPPPVEVAGPRPGEPAAEEFATFAAAFATLRQKKTMTLEELAGLLRQALASERMVNLGERASFEQHVALLLARGWQPGHEVLFPAACDVFGWRDDVHHLQAMGRLGELLQDAIDQRHMFDQQPSNQVISQRWLIARLREDALPGKGEMRRAFANFELLVRYVPTWLAIVAPAAQVERWREHYTQVLKMAPGSSFERKAHEPVAPKDKKTNKWLVWFLVMALLAVIRTFSTGHGGPRVTEPPERISTQPPGYISVDHLQYVKVPDDVMMRILQGVFYQPVGSGTGAVRLYVDVDPDGSVATIGQLESSGDPGFDDAVKKAIRGAQPYPDSLRRGFEISVPLASFHVPAVGK